MSFTQKICMVLAVFTIFTLHADEKINFISSPMKAGNAALTENGFYISRIIAEANFSPDLRMPVQFFYNSANRRTGLLGFAWKIPQLESSAVPQRDGVIWTTPWGEKIRFFEKQKPARETLPIFKDAMRGKGFFSPFSDWEADGKLQSGNWTFNGKNKLEGWRFAYRAAKLRTVTAPSGRSIEFAYENGKIIAVKQNGIAFISLSYSGNTLSAIAVNGVKYTLGYTTGNVTFLPELPNADAVIRPRRLLASCAVPGLAPVEYSYDASGYLTSVRQDKTEEKLTVQQETKEQRLAWLRGIENRKKNRQSTGGLSRPVIAGRLLSDAKFHYAYHSPEPGKVKLTDKLGRTSSVDFDSKVGIFKTTGFSGKQRTIYYFMRYDVAYNGKIRQIVDGRGRVVVSYRYDKKSGNVTRIRDMAKNDILFQYDPKGGLIQILKRGADERTASPVLGLAYASRNNPSRISLLDRSGKAVRTTSIQYTPAHQPLVVDNGQHKQKFVYTRFGYPEAVTDSFGRTTTFEYDRFNRMVSNTNPFGVKTAVAYAPSGLVARVEQRDGNEILRSLEITFDSAGQPVAYRDQRGRVKKFERDAFGRIVKEYFPDNTSVEYTYNSIGQLHRVLDQNRRKIVFNWNKFGLDSRITAENQVLDYIYNQYGMLESSVAKFKNTKKADRRIQYEYDSLDRLVKIVYGPDEIETFRYDTWGRLIASTKNGKSASFEYDYFGNLTAKDEGALKNRYAYNAYGQRTARLTVNGTFRQEERKTYDEYGRLVKIESGTSVVAYKYNFKNQLISQFINKMPIDFTYTKYGQLESKILGGKATPVSKLEYEYSKDGQIIARYANGKMQKYAYDKKGQLLSVTDAVSNKIVERYVYDPAGNILSKTIGGVTTVYTYDKANQLMTSTKNGKITNYKYDAAGRMVKEGNKTYNYGWLDKILSVEENGANIASFEYHADGQVASANTKNGKETFLWDGLALIARDTTQYVNEPYITGGNPVLADDKVLFNDILGTTLGVNSDKYNVISRDAFGMTEQSGKDEFFTGKPYIGELGYAFLFRNYRAEEGKWQTQDPIALVQTLTYKQKRETLFARFGYPDGWNNLAYGNNAVFSGIDYQGTRWVLVSDTYSPALPQVPQNVTGSWHVDSLSPGLSYRINLIYFLYTNTQEETTMTSGNIMTTITIMTANIIQTTIYQTMDGDGVINTTNTSAREYTTPIQTTRTRIYQWIE